jgi:hypothetical protein
VRSPVPVDTPRLATIRIVVQATPRGPDRCANIRRDADRWIDRSLSPAMRTPTVAAALAATIPRFHHDIEALVAIDAPPRPPANCRTPNSYADAARIAGVSGWASDALNETRILSSFRQSSSRPRSTVLGTAPGPIGDPLPQPTVQVARPVGEHRRAEEIYLNPSTRKPDPCVRHYRTRLRLN